MVSPGELRAAEGCGQVREFNGMLNCNVRDELELNVSLLHADSSSCGILQ